METLSKTVSNTADSTLVEDWEIRRDAQKLRLDGILTPYFDARSRGLKQPAADFLFEYYSFRPGRLQQWSPGFGYKVPSAWTPPDKHYRENEGFWALHTEDFPFKRFSSLEWLIELQKGILNRPMAFGCFGLHEWAMVYRSEEVRHGQVPLRMKPSEIAAFVDSQHIVCSHFDAFRFFTEDARPLNKLQPTSEERQNNEQGGCIHVNMDLYKWAYKFYPWISSDSIAEAFLLAYETRKVDMQASPYDLKANGLDPIKIETPEGRAQYVQKQQEIASKARIVREKLLNELESLKNWLQSTQ